MAAIETFADFPSTTVAASADAPSSGTPEVWVVASDTGFPAAATGVTQFHVADPDANTEVILVTNVSGTASGTVWNVTRGADNTTPVTHSAGFTIRQVVSAGVLTSFVQNPMDSIGDMIYGSAGGTATQLNGSTSNTKHFLTETAAGGTAQAPAWGTISAADVPVLNQNTTGSAGSLSATLAVGTGGTGDNALTAYAPLTGGTSSTSPVQQVAGTAASAGQVLTFQGTASLPTWTTVSGTASVTYPITVPEGGTGGTVLTSYAPLVGGTTTTAIVQQVAGGAAISGQVLTFQGTASLPTWTTTGGGAYTVDGTVTAGTYSISAGHFAPVDTTAGPVTVLLPHAPAGASPQAAVKMIIQGTNVDGTGYTTSVVAQGGDVFNKSGGGTAMTLSLASQGAELQYAPSVAAWYILDDDIPLGGLDTRYGATIGSATWSGSAVSLSAATAGIWNVALQANVTSVAFTNAPSATTVAQNLTLYISQPGTGSSAYTVGGWSGVTWFGGQEPVIATGNGALTTLTFQSVNGGQNWYGGIVSNAALPLPVADGGTGLNVLTAYAPLVGGTATTSPVQSVAAGSAGQVLTYQGTASLPTWTTVSGGGGSSLTPTAVKTANYTASSGQFVPCDTTSGGFTVQLPNAPAGTAVAVGVKMIAQGTVSTDTVTIVTQGSDVFNKAGGGTALSLSLVSQGAQVQYAGTASAIWYVLSDDLPLGQLDERYGATVTSATWSNTGATVSAATAGVYNITLGNSNTNVTLAAAPYPATVAQSLTLYLSQPSSGGTYNYGATFPGTPTVNWFGGTPPPIASGAGALTAVVFETSNGGTAWYGGVISNAATPLPVGDGGTGTDTLTAYAPLAGGTSSTAAVLPVPPGTAAAGQVLTFQGSSQLPAWTTATYLRPPTYFVPGTLTTYTVTGSTFSAFNSTNLNTGAFTAPPSGNVVVSVSAASVLSVASIVFGFALSDHGTASSIQGYPYVIFGGSNTNYSIIATQFLVTGLTAGNTYNFDLCGAAQSTDTLSLKCLGGTATTLPATAGSPVFLGVQAV